MNNKGQTLVTFILIMPIIVILLIMIYDYGMYSIKRRNISSTVKNSIKYGLKNIDDKDIDNDIKELIYKNINKQDINDLDVIVNDNSISVNITVNFKATFSFILNDINISYIGSIENNEIKIKKR